MGESRGEGPDEIPPSTKFPGKPLEFNLFAGRTLQKKERGITCRKRKIKNLAQGKREKKRKKTF